MSQLREQGIAVTVSQPQLLAEEAPYAYKDVSEMVEACEGAGFQDRRTTTTRGSGEGMRTAFTSEGTKTRADDGRSMIRSAELTIRRLDAWSVLKVSLIFYFCLMLVFMFAMLVLYTILGVIGVLDSVSRLLTDIGFGSPQTGFTFNGRWIFTRLFLIGVAGVIVWSLVNTLLVLLYNLCSDLVGGIRVTLSESK
ncbi:MAG TPA: DUF3566 domain-containing protein [Actinomycetota bacterium]